ncbi:CubicO group peptidase (beta-lactamase class C family) [Streptomyces sp. BK208]|uniref:serine hydrolase domain-containing protein n=1 Tax=Streptomyces sp. BK208 TaxID=2512150 RepID=UPI0010E3D6D3|nr:serine hydrolase domain-containing protein [Streptomyces sp. BK208]TDT42576.1 CubicO group peptidase (beta-lactamase class C family) [Streptomyces sp. BK208]
MSEPDPADLASAILRESGPNHAAAVSVSCAAGRFHVCTGFTSLAARTPVTCHSAFEVGSVSKTFTALLLAVLMEEGILSGDALLADYVPARCVPKAPTARRITALHLATHTSGLPHLAPRMLLKAVPAYVTDPYRHYHEDDLLQDLVHARPRFTPGAAAHYSNFGFALLGHLIEHATQRTFADLIDEKITIPMGLTQTTAHRDRAQADGYWHNLRVPPLNTPAFFGAGSIRSSAHDLTRYLHQHINPAPELPDALRRALHAVLHPLVGLRTPMAWHHRQTGNGDLYLHPGSTRGFTAFIGFGPTARTTCAAVASRGWTRRNTLIQNSYLLLRHYTALSPLPHVTPPAATASTLGPPKSDPPTPQQSTL